MTLQFERTNVVWIDNVTRAEVAPHKVVFHHDDGQQTRVRRLLLPAQLEDALHVGQWATHDLELPSIATPSSRSFTPPLSKKRPRAVVVWTEFAARSRLALWWACASFSRASVWVVPLPRHHRTVEEGGGFRPVHGLMDAAPEARRLTPTQVAHFAANWRSLTHGKADFRSVKFAAAPWLGEVPQPIFDLFPRVDRLAPYDQQLLTLLGTEWSSSIATFMRLLRGGDSRLMHVWGDMTLHRRLHTWSRWKRGRYVESRPSKAEKSFSGLQYRLTEEGQRLLFRLPSLDCAPPLRFGGFRFYAAGSWLMTPRGPTTLTHF